MLSRISAGSRAARIASTFSGARRGVAYKAPVSDMLFQMQEVHKSEKHFKSLKGGENATPDMIESILTEMGKFCETTLAPMNQSADQEGCVWVDQHTVRTPKGFKEAYDEYVAGGWQGLSFPAEYGGQGLPLSVAILKSEMMATANWTWGMYPGLSKGCINTLLAHGSDQLKKDYLPELVEGKWTGTMCLTEPQCGSDLAQVKTKATPAADGTYKITGTKIFISCGEHDMVENIIHCVLARLPGAPEGTRGISLFLVPKHKLDKDGNPVKEHNGVNIGRIENKMGCHGSSTCEINFDEAEGYLIGTANKGLNHMFTFINTSRLGTAIQGVGAAELSHQNAKTYAQERVSMRALSDPKGLKHPNKPADPLIVHPDIRRMLLTQKAFAEGGRCMVYHCALLADHMQAAEVAGDTKKEKELDDHLGFLTPILKGFLTEAGLEAANLGIQIWGGHGYIKQNNMEQIVRDARIAPVWEGTTGIQALDLLGRKVMLQKIKPLNKFTSEIYSHCFEIIKGSPHRSELLKYVLPLLGKTLQWQLQTYLIAAKAGSDREMIGSASVDYLMFSGYVTMGYWWLRMAEAAHVGLKKGGPQTPEFYHSKIATADFYFKRLLPRTLVHAKTMTAPTSNLMNSHVTAYMTSP